jgi:hypothetical protein
MNERSECHRQSAAFRICSWIVLTVALLLSVFVTYRILRTRWTFYQLFADFDLSLPLLTQFVLSPWYACFAPVLAVLSVAKEVLTRNRLVTLICNGIHLVLVIVIWQLYWHGLLGPFLTLMTDLQ